MTLFGRTAEAAQRYLTKGRSVLVEARLQVDTWEDKNTGQKRSKLKVVGQNVQYLDRKPQEVAHRSEPVETRKVVRSSQPAVRLQEPEAESDDVPC